MEASPAMVAYCFRAVVEKLQHTATKATGSLPSSSPTFTTPSAAPSFAALEAPVFVCFKDATTKRLRGCVGTFAAAPLQSQLATYACAALFEDSRFRPIRTEAELVVLQCTVSILHTFEELPLGRWADWTVGVHGVRCSIGPPHSPRKIQSTFLPSVAKDQGWDQRTTLTHLLHKAGYEGDVSTEMLNHAHVTRYQEASCCASYKELFKGNDTSNFRSCAVS